MNRELDGCYFRIMRDGVGQSVCFTDLTKEERDTLLAEKGHAIPEKSMLLSGRSNPRARRYHRGAIPTASHG